MLMEFSSPKDGTSVASSPFSSPNIGALLKIKIHSWSQETGLPVCLRIHLGDITFNLHKNPLVTRSGYFRKRLVDSCELQLPQDFPGGPETFEMIALFAYGSSTLIDPFNVAALRCAAEFLEMTEDYFSGNLCERFDLYLNQVVLQSWDDTLIVLQRCHTLLPWAEELLIVSRCIESIAFMACIEILDPERRRGRPVVTLEVLATQPWSSETVKEIVNRDLWIKDLVALPFRFFKRIVGSLRQQGMKEKYVSPIIVYYANKWVLSKKTRQFWESFGARVEDNEVENKVSPILQGILDLLILKEKASRAVPVGFYFALLSKSIEVGLASDGRLKLQQHISTLLPAAQVDDFLTPQSGVESICSSLELATMESIFSMYVFNAELIYKPSTTNSIVAELWDAYLSHVAYDPSLEHGRFMELIETLPITYRQCQDQLYRAVNNFLHAHLDLSQEEKGAVCKYLNCKKMSQHACIEAVQNEMMPLRLIVQALFVQQLNTHQVFKECSDPLRYTQCGDFSRSQGSTKCPNSRNLVESPYTEGVDPGSTTLRFLLQNEVVTQTSEISRKEFDSTSFRIQTLEQELLSLRTNLQLQNGSQMADTIPKNPFNPYRIETRSFSKRRNPVGEITGCIGSVNFASQRRCANRLLKIFRRITLSGSRKSTRKQPVV